MKPPFISALEERTLLGDGAMGTLLISRGARHNSCLEALVIDEPDLVRRVHQDYIAAGQIRGGEQLIEAQQVTKPGTLLAFLEPLYKGGLDGVTPGSSCIANAYSNNHDKIVAKDTGALKAFALHAVDALGLVHALILRLQALVLPFQTLVFGGH